MPNCFIHPKQTFTASPTNGRHRNVSSGLPPKRPVCSAWGLMVYAVSNGIVLAGLLVTAAMASGMILTVSLFALTAVFSRQRLMRVLERRGRLWHRLSHTFEIVSALMRLLGFE
jgi:nickel/cobalt transporter (NicO) family protein